jgi:enterochelin esterase family protein
MTRPSARHLVFLALLLSAPGASAQTAPAVTPLPATRGPIQSHQVNPDDTITFRILAPDAKTVSASLDAFPRPLPMTRSEDGLWSVTTPVLSPEYYGYTFSVDGHTILDPLNRRVRPTVLNTSTNVVLVPAAAPAPWELAAVPHGLVSRQVYTTHIAKNLPLDQDAVIVYTPPNYDAHKKGGYPVLYLLHGWSDDELGWTEVGHANNILDSLIASGKAVPMIVVMPLGYGDFDFVTHGFGVWNDPAKVDANTSLFTQKFENEVLPAVERDYNVARGRENRAIAGLSMGGLESLSIGLNHTSQFAYVAGFSSAIQGEKFDEHLPDLDPKKADLKLLWVACGTGDGLIKANRTFVSWAKTKGLDPVAIETPGAHTWLVWRDNLVNLAPLLFRAK